MGLFDLWPLSHAIIKWGGVVYLVWLAVKIARSGPPESGAVRAKPFSFLQAAAFQWVNPKAWTMALGAIAAYAPERDLTAVAWVVLVITLINFPSVSTWAALGQALGTWLADPRKLRIFNWAMAALLLASLWPVVMG
jgi:threonine/homoserine/homoserine lactone efflux protein